MVTHNGEPAQAAKGMAKGEHDAMAAPGTVWVIDAGTDAAIDKEVAVDMHQAHVVVSPDGRLAYVTNGGDNTVSVINTSAQRLVATIPVGQFPCGLRFSPDGKQVCVGNLKGGTVSVIDTASQKAFGLMTATNFLWHSDLRWLLLLPALL